ncbi:MAG: NADH-quinone oxidoreductase subunit M [Chthoniobacterales bacterium]|nr:NADH-quinone oxidoreductase subunit M [Chthoniobacterales bacterium]
MLLFIVIAPLLTALLILVGAPARLTALLGSTATLVASLIAFFLYDAARGGFQFVSSFPISETWRLQFLLGADGLSLIMLLLAALVLLCAVWFTPPVAKSERLFYACLLFIAGGAIGAFASLDLFFFYAFHELALIPTFLLIGIWGSGNRSAAAWKITIYLGLGSFVLLLGLILLYRSVPADLRSFDLRVLQEVATNGGILPRAQNQIFFLLLIGFGVLISLFPFHTWAPEAYASAPAPAAMLHAGVLKKFGLYGLLRIALPLLPEGARHWQTLLIVLLLGNIIYVGLVTIAQKRLDWMLGYSSVMHMGYIFLGIASANVIGLNGAAILMFAHGISIALLFALAGEIRARTGTLVFSDLGGLGKLMPFAGFAFGVATFASIGLPGFANFAAEVMVFFGAFGVGAEWQGFHIFQVATVLALWGVVISAVYMLRAYRAIFMGPPNERLNAPPDLARAVRLPIVLLIAATMIVGFFPNTFLRLLRPTFSAPVAANR